MPFGLGIWEILILAGVLVLLFGAKGAPAMARRLGTGVRLLCCCVPPYSHDDTYF